jgi:molybdate transport system regulatory protein
MKHPTIRFRIDFGPENAVGPGKIALLEQIGHAGSLSKAARDVGMSYRRAWQLLDSLNSNFLVAVAITSKGGSRGGGTTLTPFGKQLIRLYRAFDSHIHAHAARHFAPISPATRMKRRARAGTRVVHLSDRRPRHVPWSG